MKTDDRDERLASILDEAVRDIDAFSRDAPVGQSRVFRRAGRAVAAIAAAAMFVGAVVFAASQFERDAKRSTTAEPERVFASPDFAWTLPVPDGWAFGAARWVGGPREILDDLRTTFVSTSSVASFSGTLMVESSLPSGIVDSDVIVIVDPFGGSGAGPTTPVFNAVRRDRENLGWTWRDARTCGATGCARVYVWHGPGASRADVARGMEAAAGVQLVGTQPDPSVLVPKVDYRDGADRFTMSYPMGWTVADQSLSPTLFDPLEIVSAGTFPLRPGGRAPTEAFLPGNAIADIGQGDVFLTVQGHAERLGGLFFPARPSNFGPGSGCPADDQACLEGTSLAIEGVRAWWIPFRDPSSGRDFYAFVAMGEQAYRDHARSAAAWLVLDSLAFDMEQQGAEELPSPVREFRSEFVSAQRGYRFWPRSGRAERGVVYRFEVPHCGLGWLVDFDGSFWEGRSSIFGDDWIPADEIPDGDIGTIEFVGHDGARYEASDGTWTLLSRVDGPVVRQPCD